MPTPISTSPDRVATSRDRRPALGSRVASALTGTTSGSATPSTSYGSFPPKNGKTNAQDGGNEAAVKAVEDLLRDKLQASPGPARNRVRLEPGTAASSSERHGRLGSKRRWTRSRERLLMRDDRGQTHDDVYDSDAGTASDPENGVLARDFHDFTDQGDDVDPTEPWRTVNGKGRPSSPPEEGFLPSRRPSRNGKDERSSSGDEDKQWGVVKMELMAKTWGRKGFLTVYAGCVSFRLSAPPES